MTLPEWFVFGGRPDPRDLVAWLDTPVDVVCLNWNHLAKSGHDHKAVAMMREYVADGTLTECVYRGRVAWMMTDEQRERWIAKRRAQLAEIDAGPPTAVAPPGWEFPNPKCRPRASGWDSYDTVEYLRR